MGFVVVVRGDGGCVGGGAVKAKPMKFIPNQYAARISHRKLDRFEELNPRLVVTAFDTWDEARQWQIAHTEKLVKKTASDFFWAIRFHKRVVAMKEPPK